jgi:hypothetical protein
MDDERLLSEALRAHAAGGVSSPGGTPNAPQQTPGDGAPEAGADAGGSRLRDRFRPLGRKRADDPAPETVAHPTPGAPYPGVAGNTARNGPPIGRPAPRPGPATTDRPWQQGGPRPAARPAQAPPPGYAPAPGVPHPRTAPGPQPGGVGTGGPGPAAPPLADRDAGDRAPWTPARIAWWSGMALLAGAVAGALAAVGTLGLPG